MDVLFWISCKLLPFTVTLVSPFSSSRTDMQLTADSDMIFNGVDNNTLCYHKYVSVAV